MIVCENVNVDFFFFCVNMIMLHACEFVCEQCNVSICVCIL